MYLTNRFYHLEWIVNCFSHKTEMVLCYQNRWGELVLPAPCSGSDGALTLWQGLVPGAIALCCVAQWQTKRTGTVKECCREAVYKVASQGNLFIISCVQCKSEHIAIMIFTNWIQKSLIQNNNICTLEFWLFMFSKQKLILMGHERKKDKQMQLGSDIAFVVLQNSRSICALDPSWTDSHVA